MANKPRGDATPVQQYGKRLGPRPYGPVQHNSGSKLKQANKHLPGERKGYNC